MRKKKTYAMKRKGGAVKRMMKKGGAVKKFKPGGKVTAEQMPRNTSARKQSAARAAMAGAAMGATGAGMMAGMTVAKATKFLKNKGFNVSKKTKGPR